MGWFGGLFLFPAGNTFISQKFAASGDAGYSLIFLVPNDSLMKFVWFDMPMEWAKNGERCEKKNFTWKCGKVSLVTQLL